MNNQLDVSRIDISSLNRCLVALGMEPVYSETEFEPKLHQVANFHMGWIDERNAFEERCSKLQADCSNYLGMLDRLQGEFEASKREVTAIAEKERQTRVKNKNLSSKLKSEEDEVRRLTLMMEHKQDHFNHEIRKKERESLQLKERLSKKIMEKKTEKGAQQVLNKVPRTTSGRRAQWGSDPREELYKQLGEEQEGRNKELFQENDHLRHCLASLEKQLISMLNTDDSKEDSFLQNADLDAKIPSHINMPYSLVQETFKTSIDDKIELIKEKHRRMGNNKDAEEEISGLRKTVESQQLTITEQMVAIEDCSCKEDKQNYSDIHDAELEIRFSELLVEQERVEKNREELRKEREELTQLEHKIKDDHKRFREERTQLFETNMLATPSITSIRRENTQRSNGKGETFDSPISFTDGTRKVVREGHLYFSPAPSEGASASSIGVDAQFATPPPTQNNNIASTDEFRRELSRLDVSNLHGKILNDSAVTEDCTLESSRDLFNVKQTLLNHYMNTPV